MRPVPFTEVREFYLRNQPDGHWFDADTLRFFKSKLPTVAYELRVGGVYFVTAETNPLGEKRYSVRRQMHDGQIETVGEFHSYPTAAAARAAIKSLAA